MWYYRSGDESIGPIDPRELLRRVDNGEIEPTTYVWKKGMADWVQAQDSELSHAFPVAMAAVTTEPEPWNEEAAVETQAEPASQPNIWDEPVDGDPQAQVEAPATPNIWDEPLHGETHGEAADAAPNVRMTGAFRDSTGLHNATKLFLYLFLAVSAVAVVSDLMAFSTLSAVKAGTFASEGAMESAIVANDMRQGIVGLMQLGVTLVVGFLFLRWIHRANHNARQLGANHMLFTPGWSIGWYFVPLLNLWKPFQAMREIWNASEKPLGTISDKTPGLLTAWWCLWLFSNFTGNSSFTLSDDVSDLIAANTSMLLSDFTDIPLTIVALIMLQRIFTMQMNHVREAEGQ